MLEIHGRSPAATGTVPNIEFFRIELSPLADGSVFVALTATTVDEDEPQLLDLEVASRRVASVDEVLALIKQHVRIGKPPPLAESERCSDSGLRFRNFYRCARCGHEWSDEWSAMCDDDCPQCGARHMSPYRSEDIEPEAGHG